MVHGRPRGSQPASQPACCARNPGMGAKRVNGSGEGGGGDSGLSMAKTEAEAF